MTNIIGDLSACIGATEEMGSFTDTDSPQVSIIIVTYNSVDHISACLDSIGQPASKFEEVIVYDNASTDETATLIGRSYPEVKLIVGDSNIGYAAANNRAAQQARGKFLAFLNPDTIVTANWLSPLLEALEADRSVGAVTPALVFTNMPELINACGNTIHFSGITYCRDFRRPLKESIPAEVGAISGAAFVLSKKVFDWVGGFEESFFMYFEDTDLSLKLRCAGFRCLTVPQSKVFHSYQASFSNQKIHLLERNRYLSLLSVLSLGVLIFMLPSLLVMEAAAWGYCLLRGKEALQGKMKAWLEVVRRRNWIWERRKTYAKQCASRLFMLRAFHSHLQVQYVEAAQGPLIRALEWAGWLAAAPMLRLGRLLSA